MFHPVEPYGNAFVLVVAAVAVVVVNEWGRGDVDDIVTL